MSLFRLQSRILISPLALFVPILAACATVDEERVGPQAPGIGFEEAPVVVDRAGQQPPSLPPAAQPLPEQTSVPAEPAETRPAASRIRPEHKYVNVRRGPSSRKGVVAVLKGGKHVEVLEEEQSWVRVRWQRGGKTVDGWVYRKFVE
jgi:hypothetical protein